MLVVLKSSPESSEAKRGIQIAEDLSTDLVLMQDSVYLSRDNALEGFAGKVYALEDDLKLRGIALHEKAQPIGYGKLVDLMTDAKKVIGIF